MERSEEKSSSIAGEASQKVARIVAAAEESASELLADAEQDAQGILSKARAEADGILAAAREQVERAENALKPERSPGNADASVRVSGAAGLDGGGDTAGARLVAMNLALDGSSSKEISAHLETEFPELDDLSGLVAEVLARAGR